MTVSAIDVQICACPALNAGFSSQPVRERWFISNRGLIKWRQWLVVFSNPPDVPFAIKSNKVIALSTYVVPVQLRHIERQSILGPSVVTCHTLRAAVKRPNL